MEPAIENRSPISQRTPCVFQELYYNERKHGHLDQQTLAPAC